LQELCSSQQSSSTVRTLPSHRIVTEYRLIKVSLDGGVFDAEPYRAEVIAFTTKKQVIPAFHQIFLRGIGCNWLVCLACFLGIQGRELVSKVAGIWWPIYAFVSLGLDHVVANMCFIPLGIFQGTPGLTVGLYIWKGIIPAGLGNIVGGALFCGKLQLAQMNHIYVR
jgi:formate/nitrite transporter